MSIVSGQTEIRGWGIAATGERGGPAAVAGLASDAVRAAIRAGALQAGEVEGAGLCLGIQYGRAEQVRRAVDVASELRLHGFCDPLSFAHSITGAVVGQVALDHGIGGRTLAVNTGALSGLDAIGLAHHALLSNPGSLAIAVGADSGRAATLSQNATTSNHAEVRGAAAALVLEKPENPTNDGAVLLSSYHSEHLDFGPDGDEELSSWVDARLAAAGASWQDLALAALAGDPARLSPLRRALQKNSVPVLTACRFWGSAGAGAAATASAFAVTFLQRARVPGPTGRANVGIVLALDASGRSSCVVLTQSVRHRGASYREFHR
ncbi:MAG: hypothetical protein P4L84_29500 [Isosphaeraceae bacterium]|nr:hypothetical protein [Isosphaeraceae bacterium]